MRTFFWAALLLFLLSLTQLLTSGCTPKPYRLCTLDSSNRCTAPLTTNEAIDAVRAHREWADKSTVILITNPEQGRDQ